MSQQIFTKVKDTFFNSKNYNWPNFWYFILASFLFLSVFSLIKVDLQLRNAFLKETKTSSEIVVVMVDDKSIQKVGSWPWDRKKMQEALDIVVQSGPKNIALDFVFADKPDEEDNRNFAEYIKKNIIIVGSNPDQNIFDSENLLNSVDVQKGQILVPVGENGVVSQMNFSGQSLAEKLTQTTSKKPEIILNTKNNLPKTISLVDLLDDPQARELLKDKLVIVGSNSSTSGDFYQVNHKGRIAGVYIHALAASQILNDEYYQPYWYWQGLDVLLIIICGLLFALTTKLLNIAWNWLVSLSVINIVWLFSLIIFPLHTSFLFSLLCGLAFLLFYQLWEGYYLETKKTYQILKGRLSEAVLKLIMKNPEKVILDGQKYDATIMFTDIRGFTKMSENMDPKDIGDILNKVLGLQADSIIEHQGVIDKYIGDAVMGWWGAPIITKNHAYLALKCSIHILEKINKYNVENNTNLAIGIGLNSGPVVIGDFGSKKRFNYTAIGDVVNTASRVESLNKDYGSSLLFTENLLKYLTKEQQQEFKFTKVDTVVLRGRSQKLDIYSLKG